MMMNVVQLAEVDLFLKSSLVSFLSNWNDCTCHTWIFLDKLSVAYLEETHVQILLSRARFPVCS